jgi:hypothetical protein
MRALRRQLRIWKDNFLSVYLRLTTFHRTAIGLLAALAIVFATRHYWFTPLLADIKTATDSYAKSDPPNILPTIDTDSEIQDALLKLEGREKSLAERKKEAEKVAKRKPKIMQQNKTAVISQFGTLIAKEKLQLLDTRLSVAPPIKIASPKPETKKNSKTKSKEEVPASPAPTSTTQTTPNDTDVPNETYDYLIEGDYRNMLKFLRETEKFEYPVRIKNFRLGFPVLDPSITKLGTVANNRQLQLKFQLVLYFH